MAFTDLYPAILGNKSYDELEAIANQAREIIFGNGDVASKKHAGLILHYAREYQQ